MREKTKIIVFIITVISLILFFFLVKQASPDYFEKLGLKISLSLFTFIIAIIDGFNPCTMWILTFLLVLLISVSHSRKKIFAIGFTFIFVVFIIYFLFMTAWLNIFLFIGYFDIMRIIVAFIALFAGIVNCKEFFAFRKGITLMIQEKHKPFIVRKIEKLKEKIKYGSTIVLIFSSIVLAFFSSLVELPCTAGWPLIYVKILSEKSLSTLNYYSYLVLYNLVYIIPLAIIVLIFGFLFKGKQISKEQMKIIKFIGGLIMLALGIVLLVNPQLLMLVK